MPANFDLESLLSGARLRYTKEVTPDKGYAYSLPFDTPNGPVQVSVAVDEAFVAWALLRCVDDLSIRLRRDFYRDLLIINSSWGFARAFIFMDAEEESEWLGVSCQIPLEGINSDSVVVAVSDLIDLAFRALETLDRATKSPVSPPLAQ